jgi:hypothetical protein
MPAHVHLTKIDQQDVVADFVYEKKLEMCMFVYLDEFLDRHRELYPQEATTFGTDGIKRLLEASYQKIREDIRNLGLLTESAAGKFMTRPK